MQLATCAGCRWVQVPDAGKGAEFPALLLYPTILAEIPTQLGAYETSVAMDAPPASGRFPLVLISHGSGGTPLLYRDLAAALARSGFVVALPMHPGNNRDDNALANTAVILAERPRHMRATIDHMFQSPEFGPVIDPDTVVVIGHSLGGYTALALAGGLPTAAPAERGDGQYGPIEVEADGRVTALVLLAPATPWFIQADALKAVQIPILMYSGEKDTSAPAWHGEIVATGVPDPSRVVHRIIPNAGHFSFMSPFPAAMISPALPPSQDPEGFDRQAFHTIMVDEVRTFLIAVTSKPSSVAG